MSRRDAAWAAAVAALVLALYVATLRPDVGGTEDSPKFQLVGHVLGTAHSPGYPLYVVLTHVFTRLPIGILAYRVNLFSGVCGALACACAFLIARRLGASRLIAAAAAIAAATTGAVWRNAVVAEVYTLAALMAALTLVLLLAWGAAAPGQYRRLYAACAVFAAGLGNHLTIVGLLPAALAYGIARDRSVVRPRVIAIAFAIGVAGVLQYGFIALRTVQRAPYTEARANSVRGVIDVMLARDQSWARFQYGAADLVSIQLPQLAGALRLEMGLAALALVGVAIVMALWRRNAEVLLVAGAVAGMLALVVNLSGDLGGFLTAALILLWPLAGAGLQEVVLRLPAYGGAMGVAALLLALAHTANNRHLVEPLRDADDVRGIRVMYGRLPADAVVVADNYWTARVMDYLHLSNEYAPDPAPVVIGRELDLIRRAAGEGRPVFAFEGALPWLTTQGLRFRRSALTREPFEPWFERQPHGTHVIVAAAGRPLPFEWLPAANRVQSGRPAAFGAVLWTIGQPEARVEQRDDRAFIREPLEPGPRVLEIQSSDDGPIVTWGDDVLSALDRGLTVVVVSPAGEVVGRWVFDESEPLQMSLPPEVYALRESDAAPASRPGQIDVGEARFGEGWYAVERGGTLRFRWSAQSSVMHWSLGAPSGIRLLLRVRAADRHGTTLRALMNGVAIGSCALPAGQWADCRLDVPARHTSSGTNALMLTADTVMAPEDRRGDPRELGFAMQEGRVRMGLQ